MPGTKIIKNTFLIFLFLTSVVFAQTQDIKEHKVIKGDTLWDIANAELQNPFFWPKIWKQNTWIKNPHRIYPDQIIKIPAMQIGEEELSDEAMRQDAASSMESVGNNVAKKGESIANKKPLIENNVFISSGYIVEDFPESGKIGESLSGQLVYSAGDILGVDFGRPVKVGNKFYVVKVSKMIKHPFTQAKIGYIISIGGIAEIVKTTGKQTLAKVTESFREIDKGELLIPYYEMKVPMTSGQFRRPDFKGAIIASQSDELYQSMFGIVYIDKGWKDGIEPGDLFRTVETVNVGSSPNGVIQVIRCKKNTATAVVKSSTSLISAGNTFVGLK